jgi:hypothetical protein
MNQVRLLASTEWTAGRCTVQAVEEYAQDSCDQHFRDGARGFGLFARFATLMLLLLAVAGCCWLLLGISQQQQPAAAAAPTNTSQQQQQQQQQQQPA